MELVVLPVLLERRLMLVYGGRTWILVFVAEQAQNRGAEAGRIIDRRNRLLLGELVRGGNDPATPEVHHRIETRHARSDEHGGPAGRAAANDPDLAVTGRQPL